MEISIKDYMNIVRAVDALFTSRNIDSSEFKIGDLEDTLIKELHRIVYIIADKYTRTNYEEYIDITQGEYQMICDILEIED